MSPPLRIPYIAVGTNNALASAIGLPKDSINALRILVLLMPAEVRSNFIFLSLIRYCVINQFLKLITKFNSLNQLSLETSALLMFTNEVYGFRTFRIRPLRLSHYTALQYFVHELCDNKNQIP